MDSNHLYDPRLRYASHSSALQSYGLAYRGLFAVLIDMDNEFKQRAPATSENIILTTGKRCRVPHEMMADRLPVHNRTKSATEIRYQQLLSAPSDHEVQALETKWGIILNQKIDSS